MGFIKLSCPNCGAVLEVSNDREFGFCSFCGTKVMQERIVIEHKGQVSISGIADENALLDRAFLFIEDGIFLDANNYLEKVLDLNPRCAPAYIGKLMCQLRYTDISQLGNGCKSLEQYDYFNKAVRFAGNEQLEEYTEYLNSTIRNYKAEEEKHSLVIERVNQEIHDTEEFIEKNKKRHTKSLGKVVLYAVGCGLAAVLALFFLTGMLVVGMSEPILFCVISYFFLLFLVAFVLLFRLLLKEKQFIKTYKLNRENCVTLCARREDAQQKFDVWKSQMMQTE